MIHTKPTINRIIVEIGGKEIFILFYNYFVLFYRKDLLFY